MMFRRTGLRPSKVAFFNKMTPFQQNDPATDGLALARCGMACTLPAAFGQRHAPVAGCESAAAAARCVELRALSPGQARHGHVAGCGGATAVAIEGLMRPPCERAGVTSHFLKKRMALGWRLPLGKQAGADCGSACSRPRLKPLETVAARTARAMAASVRLVGAAARGTPTFRTARGKSGVAPVLRRIASFSPVEAGPTARPGDTTASTGGQRHGAAAVRAGPEAAGAQEAADPGVVPAGRLRHRAPPNGFDLGANAGRRDIGSCRQGKWQVVRGAKTGSCARTGGIVAGREWSATAPARIGAGG